MSFVDTLRHWDEAVTCVNRQDFSKALEIFLAIQEPNSKIFFDIGCLHLLNQDFDAAEKAFDCSIRKDEHLAIAFFQRGITFYKKKRYEESLADFQKTFKTLRGNQLIDYKALGLRYILYACDVLHNMALVEAQLGRWEKAQEYLMKALDYKTEARFNIIDKALQSILKQKLFKLVEFQSKEMFKPNKHYVAELEKKDYLGKAKVVASVVPQDEFSGFAPLQPQVEDGPTCPKEPVVLRALEGDPHTVLFEFIPETSDELAVVPGNIVFVLQKGADNWAYVVFNERKGLVPYNYLERLEISLASNKNKVSIYFSLFSIVGVIINYSGNEKQSTDNSCIVKVHFNFNFVVSVPSGSPYTMLIEKISRKLNLPSSAVTLSLTSEASEQSVISANTEMEKLWSRASSGRVTLWCNTKEVREQPSIEVHLVALHSYESSNPEDLSFQQGDKIKLLSKINQDWLEGQCNGNTGIFPASFVEEVPANSQ
uniref:Neutrophil cytosolic factor 2 n=1 Tax=Oreochromis niloticus TaxID=8128 RepID=A0A669CQZ0_ORENI